MSGSNTSTPPERKWCLSRSGKITGPYLESAILSGLRSGKLSEKVLACPCGKLSEKVLACPFGGTIWRPIHEWKALAGWSDTQRQRDQRSPKQVVQGATVPKLRQPVQQPDPVPPRISSVVGPKPAVANDTPIASNSSQWAGWFTAIVLVGLRLFGVFDKKQSDQSYPALTFPQGARTQSLAPVGGFENAASSGVEPQPFQLEMPSSASAPAESSVDSSQIIAVAPAITIERVVTSSLVDERLYLVRAVEHLYEEWPADFSNP